MVRLALPRVKSRREITFVLSVVLTAVAVVTAQCMMVSGVCLWSSARVFTTRNISGQTQLSNETATTGK